MYVPQSEHDDKQAQNAAGGTQIVNAFVLCVFLRVWSAKTPKTPKLSPMADDIITQGSIGLGSLVYICGQPQLKLYYCEIGFHALSIYVSIFVHLLSVLTPNSTRHLVLPCDGRFDMTRKELREQSRFT